MDNQRRRICICYLITTFLISAFIYILISNNLQNTRTLSRLREEVDEIAHVVLHAVPVHGGAAGESKQLTELVEGILKKRLVGIWDDLYAVKKQLKATECASISGHSKTTTEALGAAAEERVNYASEELGAKISSVIAEPASGTNLVKSLLRLDFSANPPINMLRQNMEPGSCFAFRNNVSEVTIKLAKEIFTETIALEHIAVTQSPTGDVSSAPRSFEVYGIDAKCNERSTSPPLLGIFEYENSPTLRTQAFSVKTIGKFQFIRFKFVNNHGHPNYTCVYRIAVYGRMN